jgi:hypothetical protein
MENNMFKWYGSVPRISDEGQRKKVLKWSPVKRKKEKTPK